jgi:hypothetical protein
MSCDGRFRVRNADDASSENFSFTLLDEVQSARGCGNLLPRLLVKIENGTELPDRAKIPRQTRPG